MGKKKKSEDKRGRAQDKAAHKADKKQKSKKGDGEDDFDAILEEIRQIDLKRTAVIETKCPPPSPRCFGSLVAHPEKQELLLFGGEFFDGRLTSCYNDLFIYNIRQNEWIKWQIPNPPPPRSSHQAVCVPQGGGQMWLFGGEFTSANNESFHHFKDLWMLDLAHAKWEHVKAVGGPTSRSGHRMVVSNRHLVVFGGFHESARDFLYFNDVYAFSLQSRLWHRVNASGGPSPRSAASLSTTPKGALIVMGGYSRLRMKRDGVEKSVVLSDTWSLIPLETPSSSAAAAAEPQKTVTSKKSAGKKSEPASRWKWVKINPTGRGPTARSGASTVQLTDQRAVLFGGAEDEDKEEGLQSQFLADLYQLATDGKPPRWFEVNVDELCSQPGGAKVKRRRKKKKEPAPDGSSSPAATTAATAEEQGSDGEATESEYETDSGEEMDEAAENSECRDDSLQADVDGGLSSAAASASSTAAAGEDAGSQAPAGDGVTVHSGSIFTCVVKTGPSQEATAKKQDAGDDGAAAATAAVERCEGPIPRISASLAAKGGTVFVYGGMYDQGDRQVYLDDMFSLEIVRRSGATGGWKCLVPLRSDALPWLEEEDDDDDDDEEEEENEEDDEDDEEEDSASGAGRDSKAGDNEGEDGEQSDDDDDDDDDDEDEIAVLDGEGMGEFYIRTKEQWLAKAGASFEADHAGEDMDDSERERSVKALAFQLAKAAHKAAAPA